MTIIVDASVVLAALTTQGPVGSWAEEQLLAGDDLAAPEHLYVEVANVLRRAEIANQLDPTAASLAFTDLQRMPFRQYRSHHWLIVYQLFEQTSLPMTPHTSPPPKDSEYR